MSAFVDETQDVRSIVLESPEWPGHRAGQHVDIRLTAEDGYQAQRSYSIASAPEDDELVLTVERLADGEVSPYLVDELRPGDELELRGPSGVTSSGRSRSVARCCSSAEARASSRCARCSVITARSASGVPARLLYSARTLDDVIYRDELSNLEAEDTVDVRFTLTREQPEGWEGYAGRINGALLDDVSGRPTRRPLTYVCGPTPFVETAASALVDLGHDASRIRPNASARRERDVGRVPDDARRQRPRRPACDRLW